LNCLKTKIISVKGSISNRYVKPAAIPNINIVHCSNTSRHVAPNPLFIITAIFNCNSWSVSTVINPPPLSKYMSSMDYVFSWYQNVFAPLSLHLLVTPSEVLVFANVASYDYMNNMLKT
jgi:hypothetical protein